MPLMSNPSTPVAHAAHATTNTTTSAPPPTQLQRSFTLPSKLGNPSAAYKHPVAEIGASEAIETLYVHPGARIITFTTAGSSVSRPGSSSSRRSSGYGLEVGGVGEQGTLAWSNATERTLAAGPLEIYRIPGSVSFLHSGSLLHAILPRSQCWCVDGISKFAFRVRPDTYYRIELPSNTDEERELVELLKVTLGKVLYYERTACPFRRGFGDANLPDLESLPRRTLSSRGGSVEPAKKWTFDRKWRPEGGEEDSEAGSRPSSLYHFDSKRGEYQERTPEPEQHGGQVDAYEKGHPAVSSPAQPRNMRSVTAPPQLSLKVMRTPSKTKVPQIAGRINEAVRSQVESAQTTPIRRRQQVDAPTPKLPPTPESIQDAFLHSFPEEKEEQQKGEGLEEPFDHDEEDTEIKQAETESSDSSHNTINDEYVDEVSILEIDEKAGRRENRRQDQITGKEKHTDPPPEQDFRSEPPPVAADSSSNHSEMPQTPLVVGDISAEKESTQTEPSALSIPQPTTTSSPNPSTTSSSSAESWTTLPPQRSQPSLALHNPEHEAQDTDTISLANSSSYHSLPSMPSLTSLASTTTSTTTATSTQQPRKPTTSTSTTPLALATGKGAGPSTTTHLVRRTASLFLGPPAHLVNLMLRIAARLLLSALDANTNTTYTYHYPSSSSTPSSSQADARVVPVGSVLEGDDVVVAPVEAAQLIREGEQNDRAAGELRRRLFGGVPVRDPQQQSRVRLGHRRVPGSFDFSDDEEEWGGM